MWLLLPLAFLLLVLYTVYKKRLNKYKVLNDIPGPPAYEVAKFFLSAKSSTDVYNYVLSLIDKYGPVIKLWVKPFRPALILADKTYVEAILTSKEHLHKADVYKNFIAILGDGLLSAQVNDWKADRKLVSHSFKYKTLSQHPVKFRYHVDQLIDKLKSKEGGIIDIQSVVPRVTLNIVIDVLIGEPLTVDDSKCARFVDDISISLQLFWDKVFSTYKRSEYVYSFTKDYKNWVSSNARVNEFVVNLVNRQLQMRDNKSDGKDFLDLLLEKGVSYERIVDHVKTFIITGYDTVAQGVNFAIYNIAKRPDIQEAIYNEYVSIVTEGQIATFADIQLMNYTECVVKEALRIHPIVPILQRKLVEPIQIDGKTIPSDLDVFISLVSMQTSESLFENPLVFNPDRFLPENVHKIEPNAYVPFSTGPRDCIGKKLAMLEIKFIVAYIVKHFHIHPAPGHQMDLVCEAALISKNGMPVIFKTR